MDKLEDIKDSNARTSAVRENGLYEFTGSQ